MLLAVLLLIGSFLFSVITQSFLARSYFKIPNPSAEDIATANHRLGAAMAVSIVIGVVAIIIGKDVAIICGYFFSLFLSSISFSYFRGKIMKAESSLRDHATDNLRSYGAILAVMAVYFAVVHLFFKVEVDSRIVQVLLMGGGVVFSLVIVAIASPLIFSLAWNCKDLGDDEIKRIVGERLKLADLPTLRIQVMPMKKQRSANAMVVGLTWAPEPFRARIMLADSLISDFSKEEIGAIVAHEVAHFSEGHILKRMIFPVIAYFALGSVSGSVFFLFKDFSIQLLPSSLGVLIFGVIAIANYFVCIFYLARLLVRNQELDADWVAVYKFNVPADAYFSSLDKIHIYSGASLKKSNPLNWFCAASAHPTSEERRRLVNEAGVGASAPFSSRGYKKGATVLAALCLAWVGLALFANPFASIRSIASSEPIKCEVGSNEITH